MTRCSAIVVLMLVGAQWVCGATLGGRVLEERSGAPVATASLEIRRAGSPLLVAEIETDAEGRFEVEGLAEGDYRIQASKRNYIGSITGLHLTAKGAPGVTLWLVRGGSISGRVAGQGGEPVAGATAFAFRKPAEGEARGRAPGNRYSARVDDLGAYRISGLPPGDYTVAVSWNGFGIVRSRMRGAATTAAAFGSGLLFYSANNKPEILPVSGGSEIRNVDFMVMTAALQEVTGKVEGSDPDARFDVALLSPSAPEVMISTAESGADGSFRFSGIGPGSYEVIARGPTQSDAAAPLFARRRVDVAGPGAGPVTLTPVPGQSIAIQLRSDEELFPKACPQVVALTLTPASDWGTQPVRADVRIGRETAVANLAPDVYSISARDLANECYLLGPGVLDLRDGPLGSAVAVTVGAGGTIRGRLIAGNRRLSDVAVILAPVGGDSEAQVVFPGQDQRFSFSHLRPGPYRVGVRLPGEITSSPNSGSKAAAMFPIEVPSRGVLDLDLPVPGAANASEDGKDGVRNVL